MFCGSEGLFGVALEITLRLLPKPEDVSHDPGGLRLARQGRAGRVDGDRLGIAAGAMEIMDRLAMDAADAAVGAGYPPDAQAMLIVELEGPSEEVEAESRGCWRSSPRRAVCETGSPRLRPSG